MRGDVMATNLTTLNDAPARPLVDVDLGELAAISAELEHKPASAAIRWAHERFGTGLVLAASFQDCVLIDLAAKAAPGIEVVFLDTQYHFAETLWYVDRVREHYDLNLTVMTPLVAPDDLWQTDTDECCAMRKVEPLARALARPAGLDVRGAAGRSAVACPHADRAARRRARHREGQPVAGVDRRRHRDLQARPRPARAPVGRPGLPLDRLLAVHPAGGAGRGPPLGTLGRDRARPNVASTAGLSPRDFVTTLPKLARPCNVSISHLDALEAESVHLLREVAAEFERPCLLFSGGKDRVVMLHLAEKAFCRRGSRSRSCTSTPATTSPRCIEYRDRPSSELGVQLVVASVQESIDDGRVVEDTGPRASRNRLQTTTLLDAIDEHEFDAVLRRRSRATKRRPGPRSASSRFRDEFGQWDPKNQRPELWSIYNGRTARAKHIRVFPLSQLDRARHLAVHRRRAARAPSIYFAHRRDVFRRDGMLLARHRTCLQPAHEEVFEKIVRYRTVGDMTCTGAVESTAATLDEIIAEIAAARVTERGATRADDKFSEAAMEDRKT